MDPRYAVRLLHSALLLLLLGAAPAPGAEADSRVWFPWLRQPAPRPVADRTAGRAPTTPTPASASEDPKQIPLDILRQLSAVQNVTYFLNNFVDTDSLVELPGPGSDIDLGNRFGDSGGEERKSAQNAKPAVCTPQMEVVPLQASDDPTIYNYPTCTRIDRCGGCCGSKLLSCQPTTTEIVNFKVIVTQYTGGQQMKFKGNQIVSVEKHTSCQCQCIVKETDCNQLQEYRKNECLCACLNVDEQRKCLAENNTKLWDPSTCACRCRETRACTTGLFYDQDTCSCVKPPTFATRRREASPLL